MLDLQIIASGRAMPIFDLPGALGRSHAAREIGETIDALIALMDDLSGDPDLEDNGDAEPDADSFGEPSWPEWHARGRHKLCANGGELPETASAGTMYEDAEDDDPGGGDIVDDIRKMRSVLGVQCYQIDTRPRSRCEKPVRHTRQSAMCFGVSASRASAIYQRALILRTEHEAKGAPGMSRGAFLHRPVRLAT